MREGAVVLGLDEAGRGSLVGPLVLGGFLASEASAAELRAIGVADSKLIPPPRRERLYRELAGSGRRLAIAYSPSIVDRYVRRGRLNELEAEGFARLVAYARPDLTFVDACDPVAERFGRTVRSLSEWGAPVHAAHRADREIPIVGAASIVAKVRRDRAVQRLRDTVGNEIGSGYPSDDRTVAFVRNALAQGKADPGWLRASWATTERLKRAQTARTLEAFSP